MSHHHSDLCLRTPLLRLLSLKTTDLDLLRRPLHIAFKVGLGTTGDHQQVENVLLLMEYINHGIMLQQLLTDQDGRILPLLEERLAIRQSQASRVPDPDDSHKPPIRSPPDKVYHPNSEYALLNYFYHN